MISIQNVSKNYNIRGKPHNVLSGVTFDVNQFDRVGIVGRNGAGKSTLIKLLSGAEPPSSGVIERNLSISWPLAFSGGFQGSLTGYDNYKFICRVYDKNINDRLDFVKEFADLGKFFYEPVKIYSSGMRARLAFAISLSIDFDCYLVDEVITVGDTKFHAKCHELLFDLSNKKTLIIVSHDINTIRSNCNRFLVLDKGKISEYIDSEEFERCYQNL